MPGKTKTSPRPDIFIMIGLAWIIMAISPVKIYSQDRLFNRIDSIVGIHLERDKIVGLSVGIVRHDEVLMMKGYGSRTLGKDEPVDSVTNFLTCSISKLFTATAIMQFVQQGRLSLDDKLVDLVPEFTMKDKRYKEITVYQLLTHTSGVGNYYNEHFIRPRHDSTALTEFAAKLRTKKLKYPPGVELNAKTYSNSGYNLLGLIIERLSGQPFSDYMDAHLLRPVGMDKSSFYIDRIDKGRRSTPHKKKWLTGKIKPSSYYPDIPQDKPCGNLNSCTADLCQWMLHNLRIQKEDMPGVIQPTTLRKMWTIRERIPGYSTSIGLGWWIVESKTYGTYLFHVGNDPGFSGTLILSPQNDFGIVVLANGMYPMDQVWNEIPFEIMDLFRDTWKNEITAQTRD